MINRIKKRLRIDFNKNTKAIFYLKGLWRLFTPSFIYKKDLKKVYEHYSTEEKKYINSRVDYYNKLYENFNLQKEIKSIKAFISQEKKKTYYFDLLEYVKYFNVKHKISYLFGDITEVPNIPTIVKSRPITADNKNAILMKLNKIRHFIFVDDEKKFADKKDMLVWRGKVHQSHRIYFMKKFFNHPFCDIGQTNSKKTTHQEWQKEKLSIKEQLDYKFLLAIEGNDVASNLKWSMSSNSLVLMTKPYYETWFMEGTLIADYHYVLLRDDYSDMIEKIEFYSQNIDQAEEIIRNANEYSNQFKNMQREDVISFMVLKKYFEKSNQQK